MKIKRPIVLLVLFLAGSASAQMPLFRNAFTTNVPGAYVRGDMDFGTAATFFRINGLLTNLSDAFFGANARVNGRMTNAGDAYFLSNIRNSGLLTNVGNGYFAASLATGARLTNGTGIWVSTGPVQAVEGNANAYFGYDLHDRYMPFVGGAGFLMSAGSLTVDIDANDDQTDRVLIIEHNSNTGAGAELMRVQENGNVGIGTNSPQYTLHVHGTVAATNLLGNGLGIGTNAVNGALNVHGTITGTNVEVWPPRWDDVRIPLSTLTSPSAVPGRETFRGGLSVYGFDDNSTEQLTFEMQLPHGISTNAAYGIHMHLHWTTTNAVAGANSNVVWGLEYTMADPYASFFTTTITNRVTNGIPFPFYHQLVEFPTIVTNIKESAVMVGRLFREGGNAADNLSGDACGISLDAHYPRISFGSRGEYGDY